MVLKKKVSKASGIWWDGTTENGLVHEGFFPDVCLRNCGLGKLEIMTQPHSKGQFFQEILPKWPLSTSSVWPLEMMHVTRFSELSHVTFQEKLVQFPKSNCSCDVSGWRCNLCLMVQLLRMSLRFPEATWCIRSSDVVCPGKIGSQNPGIGEGNQPHRTSQSSKNSGWGLKMSPHNDPRFAFGNFRKMIFNSTICSNRESRVGSQIFRMFVLPQKSLKIDEFEGDPVPIGWCTPFAGKRCRASWHRSFRNAQRCSELWTSENFITKYPV